MKCENSKNRINTHERLANGVNAMGEALLGLDIIIIFIKAPLNGVLNVLVQVWGKNAGCKDMPNIAAGKDVQFRDAITWVIEQWINLVRKQFCLITRNIEDCV
jgi:hypothetical protein